MANNYSRWAEEIKRVLETGCKPREGVLPVSFSQEEVLEIVKEIMERLEGNNSSLKEREKELDMREEKLDMREEKLNTRKEILDEKEKDILKEREIKKKEVVKAILDCLKEYCSSEAFEKLVVSRI